jgi:hypothetical protein
MRIMNYKIILKEKKYYLIHIMKTREIVYELDENGIITSFKNWKTILGHEVTDVVGTHFNYFIHPDVDRCMNAVENLIERKTLKEEVTTA